MELDHQIPEFLVEQFLGSRTGNTTDLGPDILELPYFNLYGTEKLFRRQDVLQLFPNPLGIGQASSHGVRF